MKHVKKLASVLLAMVMVMAMTMTAFAEGETTAYSITIKNSTEGHTYEAYQIFTGDLSGGVLSNIEWGSGISEEGQTALLSFGKGNGEAAYASAAELAAALTANNIAAFAKEAAKYLATCSSAETVTDEGTYVILGLTAGYYLVKDKDKSLDGTEETYTSYILKVVGNATVDPKSNKPTSEKKVIDTNDSVANSTTDWQDSADYDIGDDVPFKLTGTVAADYDSYTKYYFAFHDKESAGLTFDPESVHVYVDDNEITTGFKVVTEGLNDGCTFEVIFEDLKQISSVKADSVITVEYESELNSNAVIGSAGNPNVMYLEYSNNPNSTQEGNNDDTGKTPEDKVIVFTYKVVVNKVNKEGTALKGAGFTLYKKNVAGEYVKVGEELTGNEMTTFTWSGLDDGDYKLSETTTPDGYNTIADIYFKVTAAHDVTSDDPTLTSLSGTVTTGEVTFTSTDSEGNQTGSLTTDVVNQSGTTLPETGGMGTTIFYVIGSILVLGAAVVMITRKRMAK